MSITTGNRPQSFSVAFLATVVLLLAGFSTSASAAFTVSETNAAPTTKDAMAFSDFTLAVDFPGDSTPKSMTVDLPPGQLGALASATFCSDTQWKNDSCPNGSQIGTLATTATGAGMNINTTGGIFRLNPTGTELGRIGLVADSALQSSPLYIEGFLRLNSDYSIEATVPTMPNTASAVLFGNVSIDISHIQMTMYGTLPNSGAKGFFFNPPECIPATTSVQSTSYTGATASDTFAYTPTNCNTAPYNPSISFGPANSTASSPTAFSVSVAQPYSATAAKVGSPFRSTVVTLPEGVQLSGAANSDGSLAACTAAQFDYAALTPSSCPAGSKVGTVVMDSPLIGLIPGDVYLAQPQTGPNDIVQLYMMAQLGTATDSLRVKLQARVTVDPATGAQIATLVNLPDQPVNSFTFTFRAGTAPGTRQPRTCGTYTGSGVLTGYSSTTAATRTGNYVVTGGCPPAGRFRPTIAMSTLPTRAGATTVGTTTINLPVGDEPMTNVTASLPPGMIATLSGAQRCTIVQASANACPAATQVGTVAALAGQSTVPGSFAGKIYLTDAPNSSAIAGLYIDVPVQVGPIYLDDMEIQASLKLRPDFGVDVVSAIPDTVRALNVDLQQLKLTFDKANFLLNPPTCTGNTVSGAFTSKQGTAATNSSAVSVTGCTGMLFAPTLAFSASPASAGGSASFTTTVNLPASAANAEVSPPKSISLTLPDGVSLSPSANSGGDLAGCTDAQFDISTFANPTCPAGSNVGTVSIQTPSIGALTGTAYLAADSGTHTARLLVDAVSTSFGTAARVKIAGDIDVDAATGKVTTVFGSLPPVNFTSFSLTLRGGSNPVLSMPRTCGTVSGASTMVPYSGPTATPTASINFTVNCADSASFAPTFSNVITQTKAGANTTMVTTVGVPERHRQLDGLAMQLPAGLLGNIATTTRCTNAAANAGTCAAASKIGSVTALAGQGTSPGTFTGELFLTDAPTASDVAGIAVKLPAVVGPINLGNVITIASLKLRPSDYGINVSASIPTDVKGIPMYLQQLKLTIDRSGFLTNPLTCGATATAATLHSLGGSQVTASSPFTATNCDQLGFNPAVSFTAAPANASGASAFTVALTAPASAPGTEQGALKRAVVDLPTGVALSSSINSAGTLSGCTDAQFDIATFSDPACAATTQIGTASIDVPQVGTLTGGVYLAQTTPSGAIAGLFLDAKSTTFGASVRVKLAGRVDVDAVTGKTTATFDNAPAVAFTNFSLTMRGGAAPALSMPRTCGTPAGTGTLMPQSGAAVVRTGTLTIDQNCAASSTFAATGSVALSNLNAGQSTSVTTTVSVPAGARELSRVNVSLPPGLLANINGVTRCTVAQAQAGTCAASTAIGTISADTGQGATPGTFNGTAYLVDPVSAGDMVSIGLSIPVVVGPINLGTVNVVAPVKLRSDYGIDISADVPTAVKGIPMYIRSLSIAITKAGFLFNPSTCGTQTTSLGLTSAAYGGATSTANSSSAVVITGCGSVAFDPTVAFSATPPQAGGAGAFNTRITFPASPSQAALGAATVTLPAGVSLSPSIDSAGTLTGCTDAQFNQPTPSVATTCPALSKIGTTAIQTASVGALTGSVYLAATAPGHLARVFVYAVSTNFPGAGVKMSGTVDVDPATGATTAVFGNAPPVPFQQFDITFQGGSQPAISLPRACGTQAGSVSLTSQAGGAPVARTGTLTINTGCATASQFTPTATVASNPTAAAGETAFKTTITVPAGQQELSHVHLSLPPGLLANIDGHPRCAVSAANAGTCAANTKIGVVSAKAGQGDTPGTFGGGTVYLADAPTAGDLVGLAIALPVRVGSAGGNPIVDLGQVTAVGGIALRQDYGIDLDMAVPTQVRGIPMGLRQVTLTINDSGFMINPPTCTGNAVTGSLGSAQAGSAAVSTSLAITNCAGAAFNPAVAFSASPAAPAKAAAFTTQLSLPAGDQSPLKKAVVTLPAGVSLSASANAGGDLVGCTDAQFGASTWADPTCLAGSKVGTVTIQTLSVGAVTGSAYLAATAPNGSIARLMLDATSSAFGARARIKVLGTVAVDPATGATTATFDGLPPVAFSTFALTLRGGTNPVISLPRTCGSFAGAAALTPHAGGAANASAALVLDQSCPPAGQFAPTVDLSLAPNDAGGAGKLTTTINVPGGDQELSKVRIDMPEGLTAKLKGAPRCTIAQAQSDSCDPSTQIGTVDAQVGVSGAPYAQSGKVYLTEGRAGNVAGMAIILPAVVGPIDLGEVITIADVQLRSPDLALQITADVPTTVQGVRLDLRQLKIAITKDDFLVNPSSCGTLTGSATFTGAGNATSTDQATIDIPAASCAAQTFDPQIAFSAGNAKPSQASDFTTTVTLANGPGAESPFKSVAVRLPAGMSLSASAGARGDLAGCTDAQFRQDDLVAASTCPAGSAIGTVTFETDLVGDLTGTAYLAPATDGNLARIFLETTAVDVPNLTVRIVGEVKVNPDTGATDAVFASVPAIPVTKFQVTFRGGDAPTLALPRLCGAAAGSGTFTPVNGGGSQTRSASLVLSTGCPDPSAFTPTAQLSRSTTNAGRSMTFTTTVDVPAGQQELSSLKMALPPGLLGKISSVPACERDAAAAGNCPASSKVGTVTAAVGIASAPFSVTGGAYLVKGDHDSIARLAIVLPAKVGPIDLGNVITMADLKLRGDYGLTITAAQIPTTVKGVRLDLHHLALAIDKPDFMVNPVSCAAAIGTTMLGAAQGGSQTVSQPFVTDGCDNLKLDTSLGFGADPASPASASAVTTQIRASAPAGSPLDAMQTVHVTLPEGVSLSPSAGARGDLAECTADQFQGSNIDVDAACPAGSVVGSVKISSPMVGDLSGDAYLGAKTDGHFSGVFLQAKAADYPSLRVKLAGTLDVDATTGRLTAAFDGLPQVQVSGIDLTLRGGDAPVLSLPRTCGDFGASLNVARYGGGTSDASGTLTLNSDCPDPSAFAPTLGLSASPTQAAADTALSTVIDVPGRQQELTSLDLAMPSGLLGRLTVVPHCAVDAARANQCSDASLVGSVTAKVGVATAPYAVTGKVYMTDGFDGSIAGLMFALPAKVGPIDLGNVVTLAQLQISGNNLQLRVVAKDIPTRVQGIPLSISQLAISIDHPGVVINASQCAAQQAAATFGSAQGGSASAAAGYQATGCEGLNWKPSLKVAFSGPAAEVKVKGHPTLATVIEQTAGQGNLRTAAVTMPDGVAVNLKNVNARVCESAAAASAGTCPEASRIGTAEILTSALPEPVDGGLYIVKIPGATLPGIAIRIRDQISFDVVGTTKLDKAGRIVALFDGLPDTPISKMTLVFAGGQAGVLQLGKEICGAGVKTDGVLTAQHGAQKTFAIPVDCNGTATPIAGGGKSTALAAASFRPSGSSAALTFALSNQNGITKIIIKMPKGAIFTKQAVKLVKLSLTGAKARTVVHAGPRRMAIAIKPLVAGQKVIKVKFKLPAKAIKINIKVKKVLADEKTSKKKKAKILAKLLSPTVTTVDGTGVAATVKLTVKVAAK